MPPSSDDLTDAVALAHRAARATHGDVDLPLADYRASWERAAARHGRPPGDAERASDLYLAAACDAEVPGAWEALLGAYLPRLKGLLKKRGASETEASDVLADLPGLLCSPPPEGEARTRIGTFDGGGRLFSWLAVVVLRTADQRRRSPTASRHAPWEAAGEPVAKRGGPAHATLGAESTRRFESAVSSAWDTLTSRERLAVLWRFREGLQGREIARLLGIGAPRVSRLLESGLARLRDAVRRQMPDTPPGTKTGEESVWQAMTAVLARHLASFPGEAHDQGKPRDG